MSLVTPLVLTYNEEANIGRVLQQLAWADEIMVVDSYSTDSTLEIVARYPQARVVQRAFDHFADQLNFGLSQVKTPWVLTMDADYVLSDKLIEELHAKLPYLDKAGYRIAFRYCVAGTPLPGSIYPPRVALFQTRRGHFTRDGHAQQLVLQGEIGTLGAVIYHDDRKPLSAFLRSQDWYENLEVAKLATAPVDELSILDRARRTRWLAPVLVAVYCLLWKRLIFEGRRGLFYTLQRVYTELLLSIKLLDYDLQQETRSAESLRTTSKTSGVALATGPSDAPLAASSTAAKPVV